MSRIKWRGITSFAWFLLATTYQIIRSQLWTIKLSLMGRNYDLLFFRLATVFRSNEAGMGGMDHVCSLERCDAFRDRYRYGY